MHFCGWQEIFWPKMKGWLKYCLKLYDEVQSKDFASSLKLSCDCCTCQADSVCFSVCPWQTVWLDQRCMNTDMRMSFGILANRWRTYNYSHNFPSVFHNSEKKFVYSKKKKWRLVKKTKGLSKCFLFDNQSDLFLWQHRYLLSLSDINKRRLHTHMMDCLLLG